MDATLAEAVTAAVAALDLKPQDAAAAALAATYARQIDQGHPVGGKDGLGPLLLAVLESLLMTPRARAAVVKGVPDAPVAEPTDPLDELERRRERRRAG